MFKSFTNATAKVYIDGTEYSGCTFSGICSKSPLQVADEMTNMSLTDAASFVGTINGITANPFNAKVVELQFGDSVNMFKGRVAVDVRGGDFWQCHFIGGKSVEADTISGGGSSDDSGSDDEYDLSSPFLIRYSLMEGAKPLTSFTSWGSYGITEETRSEIFTQVPDSDGFYQIRIPADKNTKTEFPSSFGDYEGITSVIVGSGFKTFPVACLNNERIKTNGWVRILSTEPVFEDYAFADNTTILVPDALMYGSLSAYTNYNFVSDDNIGNYMNQTISINSNQIAYTTSDGNQVTINYGGSELSQETKYYRGIRYHTVTFTEDLYENTTSSFNELFKDKTTVTSIIIPCIGGLGMDMFSGDSALQYVSVRSIWGTFSIGDTAFQGCSNLKVVYINGDWEHDGECMFAGANTDSFKLYINSSIVGSFDYQIFEDYEGTPQIYVKADMLESYRAASNWSAYADNIQKIDFNLSY